MKIAGNLLLLDSLHPKGIPHSLTLVRVRNVSLARLPAYKEEVILPMLYFQLLLDDRHIARHVIEAIPS